MSKGRIVISIKVNIRMIRNMAKELSIGRVVINMWVVTCLINVMDMEKCIGRMELGTKGIG